MKTPNASLVLKQGSLQRFNFLTMAFVTLPLCAVTARADLFWVGGTASYNTPTNWSTGVVPGTADNADNDNGSNNVVQINSGDPNWSAHDLRAGNGNGASGAFFQDGPTVNAGGWVRLGIGVESFGTYTLNSGILNANDHRINVGELGTGVFFINGGTINFPVGQQYALADGPAGSTGTVFQTNGTVNSAGEVWVGNNAGVGVYNLSGGTLNANTWVAIGRSGGTGTVNMTGGTFNHLVSDNNNQRFLIGTGNNSTATFNQSGGTLNCLNQYLVPDTGTGCKATNNISGTAVLNVHDWIAVGRNSGTGVMNISGGTIARDNGNNGNGNFDVGAGGPGTVNQTGGSISNLAGQTWIGESSTATYNLSAGTANLGTMHISQGAVNGTFNLNGGSLIANEIATGNVVGFSTLNLNGGTILPATNNPTFLHDITLAFVSGGGAIFNTQGFNVTASQSLQDGGGSLTKNGAGTLTLSGTNAYSGGTFVNAGALATTTTGSGGDYTVAGGAAFGLQVVSSGAQLNAGNFTLAGPATTLNFDVGAFGNPAAAPLNVGATLNANGTVTINVADGLPQVGQFALIKYAGRSGSAIFTLGTLPVGVIASIVDDTVSNSIDLNITTVNLPRWDGQAGGNWDIGLTTNWVNIGTGLPTFYGEGNVVAFNDSAAGTTTVNLVTTVNPGGLTVNNTLLPYTLVGTGKINGPIGLTKSGTNTLAILNTGGNSYTGPTVVTAGTLVVSNLANGGSPSGIGSSSASPTNLALGNATLSYVGPSVTVNRGYSITDTNTSIDTESNLTLSGLVTASTLADFVKTGPAQLTYATAGSNALSGATSAGFRTIAGTTAFIGPAGGQTNLVNNHFGVGGLGGTNAAVIVSNATLNLPSGGVDLGRSGGATGTLTVNNNAVVNQSGGNVALGDGNGTASAGVIAQNGGNLNISGQLWVGQNLNGVGTLNLSGGTFTIANWLAVGRQGGTGILNISGNAVLLDIGGGGGNFDIGTSGGVGGFNGSGTVNQTGGFITNTASDTWLGEASGTASPTGVWNMSGGSALLGSMKIGYSGNGTSSVNVSGAGAITCNGFVSIGFNGGVTGNLNIGNAGTPGGSLTMSGGQDFNVGDGGIGIVNMVAGGGGHLTVPGTFYLTRGGSASGTVNLNGGIISAGFVNNGFGFGNNLSSNPQSFNFNGGTLKALFSANPFMWQFVSSVVQSNGAIIDDGGFIIAVNSSMTDGGGGGGLTKIGTGKLLLNGTNTYTGSTLVNTGALGGTGIIAGHVAVAPGATLAPGSNLVSTLTINNTLTLAAGSSSFFKVSVDSGATNDVVTGLTGVTYAGSLIVTNVGSNSLAAGGGFKLFNAGSPTGNFSSVTVLPSGSGTFNPATGVLTIVPSTPPVLNPAKLSGGNVILTGTGGNAGSGYTILSTTNVLNHLVAWTTNTTGTFNGSGAFSNAIPVVTTEPSRFFIIRVP